jgi:hypothetical protein
MLTAITPPTTSNLMAPETVAVRLGLPESDELTEQIAEASGLVARYLGFRPEYATWQETFTGVNGDRLYLGARPTWAVTSVTYRDGAAQAADAYRLDRGPYGESSLLRAGVPWGVYRTGHTDPWFWEGDFQIGGVSPSIPDWTITYTAGWWLEEMTGTMPVGVEPFPAELRADFLRVVRWLRSTAGSLGNLGSLGISRMSNEGANVEFFSPKDMEADPATGIPASCTRALSLYRRAT